MEQYAQSQNDQSQYVSLKEHYKELKNAADYILMRKNLNTSSVFSIIFGAIALINGLGALKDNSLNWVLVLIGAGLLAEGIYILVTKSPVGLMLDGIALIVLGIWNMFIAITNMLFTVGGEPEVHWIVLAIFQIVLGIKSFKRHSKYSKIKADLVHHGFVEWVEEVIKKFKKSKNTILVTKQKFGLTSSTEIWHGLLMREGAVFRKKNGAAIEIAPKDSVELTIHKMKKKKGRAKLSLFDKELVTGVISKEHADKFSLWKNPQPQAQTSGP